MNMEQLDCRYPKTTTRFKTHLHCLLLCNSKIATRDLQFPSVALLLLSKPPHLTDVKLRSYLKLNIIEVFLWEFLFA